jgi:hypothetical protein
MDPKQSIELGNNPATGKPVRLEVDPCKLAKAQLKEAGIPLYDVPALQEAIKQMREQANDLRAKAGELEQQIGQYEGLVSICARRDMELASKGMKLEDGRVVLTNGRNA